MEYENYYNHSFKSTNTNKNIIIKYHEETFDYQLDWYSKLYNYQKFWVLFWISNSWLWINIVILKSLVESVVLF